MLLLEGGVVINSDKERKESVSSDVYINKEDNTEKRNKMNSKNTDDKPLANHVKSIMHIFIMFVLPFFELYPFFYFDGMYVLFVEYVYRVCVEYVCMDCVMRVVYVQCVLCE